MCQWFISILKFYSKKYNTLPVLKHFGAGLLVFLILLQPAYSFASNGYIWRFDREEDLKGWSGQGAKFSFLKQEGIIRIEDGIAPAFISPLELNLSINDKYSLKIRLKGYNAINPKGFVMFKQKDPSMSFHRTSPSFNIKADGRFHDYKIDFKEPMILEQFLIVFKDAGIIEIDSIEIYEPSFIKLFWHKIKKGVLAEETISSGTINTVATPMIGRTTFPAFLYYIAAIISVCVIIFKRKFTMDEIRKAVIVSFICIGFIFALRMDFNWLMMMKKDIKVFSGIDVGKRINILFGDDLYDFAAIAKKIIPSDKKARKDISGEIGEGYFGIRLYRYYLLPIRTSKDGEYVLAYMDKSFVFDPVAKTLTKDGNIIVSPVEMIYNYNNYGFIYRIIK